MLGACASLPKDGPSARDIAKEAGAALPYVVVPLDYPKVQSLAAYHPPRMQALAGASSNAAFDLIGEGDVLSVTIIQPRPVQARAQEQGATQDNQELKLVVDRSGAVQAPYAGAVTVAGMTPAQAAQTIQQRLRGRMVDPQVLVSLVSNQANTVTVLGEVRATGRYPLTARSGALLDVLASAGGPTRPAADTVLTVVRDGRTISNSLAEILADPAENIRLAPGDQVRLAYAPRKFSTFGAFTKTSQMTIDDDQLSLAGAISRLGGLDPNSADAGAVYVFRMEPKPAAAALGITSASPGPTTPVVYTVNLKDPAGLFIANAFEIRRDDLIYVPRAGAAEVHKFFDLVSSISRVGYDVTVATVVH